MTTVFGIVAAWLRKNGYDGLYNKDAGCACLLSDLAPCGEMGMECRAGYKRDCRDDAEDPRCAEGYDWIIGPNKES